MSSDTDKNTAKMPPSAAAGAPRQESGDVGAKDRKRGDPSGSEAHGRDKTGATTDEVGGRGGLDPTRYGDWEINGRCVDF